jgi:hypothetical protein
MTDDKKNRCFTIMPFTVREQDLQRYYNDKNHWNEVYRGLIVPAVLKAGLMCERDDEDSASRLITENIWQKIEKADVILCDLSAHNPNVYLELGWTLRADKRFVLIKDDITQFNFDLNQFFTYEYSHHLQPSALETTIKDLADVISATLSDNNRKYSMVSKLSIQLQVQRAVDDGNIEVSLLKELLSEVRSSRTQQSYRSQFSRSPKFSFSQIKSRSDLSKLLIGSTWRKKNDLEHIIFVDDTTFYNNHAGHPTWRKNSYSLEEQLGTMTIVWSVDGAISDCAFNDQFNEFIELADTNNGIWSIIATEPHTPAWGI